MGFGILFLGYLIAAIFSMLGTYSFVGMLIGYFLMFRALTELRRYCPTFLYAIIGGVLMLLCSFYESYVGIDTLLGLGLPTGGDTLARIFDIVEFAIELAFNIVLLYGIADLARRVDFQDIRTKAYTNMIFVGIYNAFHLFLFLPFDFIQNDKNFLYTLLMLLMIIYSVLNLSLIFKCYAFICPQGDEEMERRPSRFEFVNKWRARNDAKEQETLDYYNKKLEERRNKYNHKKKKK